jgi:hypothetical protein
MSITPFVFPTPQLTQAEYDRIHAAAAQNMLPQNCYLGPQMGPSPGLLTKTDRSPMPELKVSDLTFLERCRYWWLSIKVRRKFKKENREQRIYDINKLAYDNFHKWKNYADMRAPKK